MASNPSPSLRRRPESRGAGPPPALGPGLRRDDGYGSWVGLFIGTRRAGLTGTTKDENGVRRLAARLVKAPEGDENGE